MASHGVSSPSEDPEHHMLGGIEEVSAIIDSNVNTNPQSELTANPNAPSRVNKFALRCAIAASFTSVLLGFVTGIMIETGPYAKKDQKIIDDHIDVQTVILYVVSLLGSVMAGWSSDKYGRRWTIGWVGFFFFFGPFLMGFAPNSFFVWLGRFIVRIGVGYTQVIAPLYVAEISPPTSRGFFTSLPEVSLNVGIVLGHLCNFFFSKFEVEGWIVMLCVGTISLLSLIISVRAIPESPRWLVIQRRTEDARRILLRLSDSEEEAALLINKIKEAAGIPTEPNENVQAITMKDVWWQLLHPIAFIRHMIICAIGIHVFQQACGMDIILLYNPRIFEKADVSATSKKLLWNVAVEWVKVAFTFIGTLLIDRTGRRPLLLCSIAGIIGSLLFLGTCLIRIDQRGMELVDVKIDRSDMQLIGLKRDKNHLPMWCMISLFLYVACYSVGMGPVASIYNAELFPPHLRGQGSIISFAANQLSSAGITFLFLLLVKRTSLGGAIFLFAVGAIIAWTFFFIVMPETKECTLEDTSQRFGKYFWWRFRNQEMQLPTTGLSSEGLSNEDLEHLE